jgi:hypothetical protein
MKNLISYAVIAFLATTAMASPDDAAIEAKEKAAWQAFRDKKADDFKKLLSPEMVAVYSTGVHGLQDELNDMSKMNVKSSELGACKIVMSDPNTAISTYTVKLDATADGQDVSGTHNCATVWQRKNGEWLAVFHTDMKAETAAK